MENYRAWCKDHPEQDPRDFFKKFGIHWKIDDQGTQRKRWVVWTNYEKRPGCMKTENIATSQEEAEIQVLGELEDCYKSRKKRGALKEMIR